MYPICWSFVTCPLEKIFSASGQLKAFNVTSWLCFFFRDDAGVRPFHSANPIPPKNMEIPIKQLTSNVFRDHARMKITKRAILKSSISVLAWQPSFPPSRHSPDTASPSNSPPSSPHRYSRTLPVSLPTQPRPW